MNNDVLSEILLCLPVQSLLRFRAVCKTWGNVIDSQSFRKLHTHNNDNNKSDDMVYLQLIRFNEQAKVYLQVTFVNVGNRVQKELSIKLQSNWNSQLAYDFDQFNDLSLRLVDAVKGLICFNSTELRVPIAICNPFLRELKLLPLTPSNPSNSSCKISRRVVAIGFDEDYKVVQLLTCIQHRYLHAQVYSKSTDSWRELADLVIDDVKFYFATPIKSGHKNGYFAYWYAHGNKAQGGHVVKILCLDMKNEVFREITLPKDYTYMYNYVGLWGLRADGRVFTGYDYPIGYEDWPSKFRDMLGWIPDIEAETKQGGLLMTSLIHQATLPLGDELHDYAYIQRARIHALIRGTYYTGHHRVQDPLYVVKCL